MDLTELLDDNVKKQIEKRRYQRSAYLRRKNKRDNEFHAKLEERAKELRREFEEFQKLSGSH